MAGFSEKKGWFPPTKLHDITIQNTPFSSVFDSFVTNKIQSIFVITVVHREASYGDTCSQGQTSSAINHS